jgi:hypothetical protein
MSINVILEKSMFVTQFHGSDISIANKSDLLQLMNVEEERDLDSIFIIMLKNIIL